MSFRKAQRERVFFKIAVTGPTGSGKTYSSLRLARGLVGPSGKIAVIDTENGSASLYAGRFDFDVKDIEPPFEHAKFVASINEAVQLGYNCVVIDSASHFWEGILEYKGQLDSKPGSNSYTNWRFAGEKFSDILKAVLQSPVHLICCMRSKMDYVQEADDRGKKTVRKIGLAPIMRDGIEYEFTTVFDVDLNHKASCSKDRSEIFTDKIFQITEQTGADLEAWRMSAPEKPAQKVAEAPVQRAVTASPERPTSNDIILLEQELADHEAAANAFLIKQGWIQDGQTYRDVSAKHCTLILGRIKDFVARINA